MPFQATYRCSDCNCSFDKITDLDPRKRGGRKPSCPECNKGKHSTMKSISKSDRIYTEQELDKNRVEMEVSGKMPSIGGTNNFNKALDLAANICMSDGNMTNINIGSNLREGDNCAPKLSHELERKVDDVFKTQANRQMGMKQAGTLNNALTAQINAGKFAGQSGARDIVAQAQSSGVKVPTTIIHSFDDGRTRGKPN